MSQLDQVTQQDRAKTLALQAVLDHEGDLDGMRVLCGLVAAHADEVRGGCRAALIHERQPRPARQHNVKVHLGQRHAAVFHMPAGNDLKTCQQGLGFNAAVGLYVSDDQVRVPFPLVSRLQHGVGLPDAGRVAQEDF